MDINKFKESVADVLKDDEVKQAIKDVTDEQVEILLDKKEEELEEQCRAYKAKVDAMAESRIKEEVSKMEKVLLKYTDRVVEEFIAEHDQDFRMYESSQKIETILEGLKMVMAMAGIHATEVLEGVEIRKNKLEGVNTARVKNLQEQVEALAEQNKTLQKSLSVNKKKLRALTEDLEDLEGDNEKLVKENETLTDDNKELSKENQNLEKENESLKKDLGVGRQKWESLIKENESLNKQNKSLSKENQDVVRMGVISELKNGLTLTESKKFEKMAENIPFSADRDYIRKLKDIRDGIQGSTLNEVTGETPKKQESESTGYRRFL
jgi:chromosome segregation ATPase